MYRSEKAGWVAGGSLSLLRSSPLSLSCDGDPGITSLSYGRHTAGNTDNLHTALITFPSQSHDILTTNPYLVSPHPDSALRWTILSEH